MTVRSSDLLTQAERDGVDLSLLRERLKLTPTQRLERHQAALELVEALHEAGRKHRRGSGQQDTDSAQ